MKDNGVPAFPHVYDSTDPTGSGMTIRQYFAAQALTGLLANSVLIDTMIKTGSEKGTTYGHIAAKLSHKIADIMLEEGSK